LAVGVAVESIGIPRELNVMQAVLATLLQRGACPSVVCVPDGAEVNDPYPNVTPVDSG
jgi:hypothetical protein